MSDLVSYLRCRAWRRGLTRAEFRALDLQVKPRAQAREFIGAYGAAKLALRINRMSNRRGLVADKLLLGATLRGAGLPAPDVIAVAGRPAPPGVSAIRTVDAMREVLADAEALPLFGKPLQGQRGGGEIAILGYDHKLDEVLTLEGHRVPVEQQWARMQTHGGYLFQGFLRQHPALVRTVGPVVATARIVTVCLKGKAQVLRAFWKVPVADGVTDHPRAGHGAAAIDTETGRIGAVIVDPVGSGCHIDRHPGTGASLDGLTLPHWAAACRVATQGARLFHVLPLIGWDIAICADGPVIVEANTNPSLELPQYLTGVGALSGAEGKLLRTLAHRSDRSRRRAARAKRRRRLRLVTDRIGLKHLPTET